MAVRVAVGVEERDLAPMLLYSDGWPINPDILSFFSHPICNRAKIPSYVP